jgi:hypothetical protein
MNADIGREVACDGSVLLLEKEHTKFPFNSKEILDPLFSLAVCLVWDNWGETEWVPGLHLPALAEEARGCHLAGADRTFRF